MALKEFKLPDIGEGVAEGEIVSWKVAVGDTVEEEQDFVEVMTDKATVTITMPWPGVIHELKVNDGDVVPVETVIAVIDTAVGASGAGREEASQPEAQPEPETQPEPEAQPEPVAAAPAARIAAATPPASPGRVLAAPGTRRRAREAGVDLSIVSGTGPNGRVTNEDLAQHLVNGGRQAPVASPTTVSPTTVSPTTVSPTTALPLTAAPMHDFSPGSVAPPAVAGLEERVPFRGVRKKISEAMTQSKFTATHFTVVEDVDVTDLVALRDEIKSAYADMGIKVTYTPFLMKAVVAGLREQPWLNSTLDETTQEVVLKRYYNLGIATDTDNGLIVPVIRDVDRKSIVQLSVELQELVQRTREGKVQTEDLQGGTFTITNAGSLGGLMATPIINFPEVAILGAHKIHDAPRVVDGEIRVRKVMYLSCSIDHRIVDGAAGVRFLNVLARCLSDPRNLLLEA
ncbi:MAG: dienelactone hydrolase [Planctomycetes bacterium]|jgi:pyruvate dehydrogenase E2 component (dihydrolipoamide acetyltransferase)|nr:dienelactone hydrolase [Planctomycetota bacterium]